MQHFFALQGSLLLLRAAWHIQYYVWVCALCRIGVGRILAPRYSKYCWIFNIMCGSAVWVRELGAELGLREYQHRDIQNIFGYSILCAAVLFGCVSPVQNWCWEDISTAG